MLARRSLSDITHSGFGSTFTWVLDSALWKIPILALDLVSPLVILVGEEIADWTPAVERLEAQWRLCHPVSRNWLESQHKTRGL